MARFEVFDGTRYHALPGTPGPQMFAQVGGTPPTPRGVGDVWVNTSKPLLEQWDDDWQYPALMNGWRDQNPSQFGPVRYRRMPGGLVLLEGLVTGGPLGYGTAQAVFILPEGYRANERHVVCGISTPGTGVNTRINIDVGGVVSIGSISTADTGWVSLHCAWHAEV